MAESLLFSVADSLIGKITSLTVKEASSVLSVKADLNRLKETLSFIKAVLLDAEQKQQQNNELRVWLRQIKRVFSDAEDIIDDVECEALRKHVVNTYVSNTRKVRRFFSTSNPLVYRLRMAHQIKDIKQRLDKVAADRHKFGLQTIENDTRVVHRREMTHSHVDASDVIGRENDKDKILELLLQHDGDDKSLSVIPIVGMGGLGKTTLAKLVFNDERIDDKSFPLKMWVCVSDNFELEDLLRKILKSDTVSSASAPTLTHQESFKSCDMEQLQHLVRSKLDGKKFLLVLDDVWNRDRVKWVELKNLLQGGAAESKILVTTRSHSVATMVATGSSYELQGLSEDDSLSLFVKWAFKEGEERRYPELSKIGKEIMKKCGGLPLAVRTLGSSLFLKVDMKDWESVRDNEIWKLPQKEGDILPALQLSYDQLPSYLKPCFACFSLFPKDFGFRAFHVIRLWEAHGFLPSPNKNKTPLDFGIELLRELQSRSFLQDFIDFGTACMFKLHDLVLDLAMYVANNEFQLINSCGQNIFETAQHLSFVKNDLHGQTSIPRGLRTVIFPEGANDEAFLKTLVSRCKYLRFLKLINSEYESLPRSIGKLKHLRYLCLTNNQMLKSLPKSLSKLQNLQALHLSKCPKLQTLPKGIGNLISLRILSISTKQSDFPDNDIAKLTSLEILCVKYCDNLESFIEGIRLPNLKRLEIVSCGSLKSLPVHASPNLETLFIIECDKLELSKGVDNQIPQLELKFLQLHCLPQLVTWPQWLQRSVSTLHSLIIKDCGNLEELPEQLSASICLKTLAIVNCPKLHSLPDDMNLFTNLEYLQIGNCLELCRRYQPEVGLDWPKISHIKQVYIYQPVK
ncbi:putative disease resistance protein RGA3 [Gastrolobium bilobum]|uniref:putative disease resistance protein RGA3 n=1 Tax=Gastrolobium bilobum TaxID=150636 RepID=UPI002AB1106B|nr:putative disease resistance protein RGA3 [Gastrolobium bilobum]XP_061360793.1 putative disease resistance protein RGA3 [Gastrolobium bilobum]XP_061360794.1 putative disease resistance protein RGA3 [Gastrolobium bilobum]